MIERLRHASFWPLLTFTSVVLAAHASPAPLYGADGIPATVMTLKGDSVEGRFLGATGSELTIETSGRTVAISLREVRYISFVGRPATGDGTSFARPGGRASDLRMEGSVSEQAGRLDEALRRYEEAAKLDPADTLTAKAVERVRQKVSVQEAGKKAALYKKLAVELKDARRYGEAAACYDQAIRLDPHDEKFKESLAAMRHYWAPTTCPAPNQP